MSTSPVTSVTDELIAELEAFASKAGSLALDSAETVKAASGAMIECPVCGGEGYASAENDYCNFDNHAIGVEFYGIGPEFGLAEAYFRAANPATILALLAERAELKRDAERYRWLRMADWWDSSVCVIKDPKSQARLGSDCPSRDRLDAAIDAAMQS